MFGKITTEIRIAVKAGTNSDDFVDENELRLWLHSRLLEFELELNTNTKARIHLEELKDNDE